MPSKSLRPELSNGVLQTLDKSIRALTLVKDACVITPAEVTCALLTIIRDSMGEEQDFIELGVFCADVCIALERGLNGGRLSKPSQSVLETINELTATVAAIQNEVKLGKQSRCQRLFHTKNRKGMVAAWKQDLDRMLQIFNTELLINNDTIPLDPRHNALDGWEGVDAIHASVVLGELPPPPPRACFGRDELIEGIIGLAENLKTIALIGAGGIGKTAIALTVLHDDRIKNLFGNDRRFVRCDQFPASRAHFLNRLSKVIGVGAEHPEDLASLRSSLSAREMILVLDNAESILDPQGPDAPGIYSLVEELSRFSNICLCITSRISTVPPHFNRPIISALSTESACDIFYGIYNHHARSDIISNLVEQLDFHPLSITLLATTASHNTWDYDRLAKEWEAHRAHVLSLEYNEGLAATIELSLASPTFRKLGPDARDLLGVIAFFPQGVDEENADLFFPTVPNREDIFDKFCVLSLTHRSDRFITMLAPLRDYLSLRDPQSSAHLSAIKDCYFTRLSVFPDPDRPEFGEGRWITSEDVNIEYLLDVFISINRDLDGVLDACVHFMRHIYWHKPRQTILGSKIEGLPDGHRSKPQCLFQLSRLFQSVGNREDQKRLLAHALRLERVWGDEPQVAQILKYLSDANRLVGLHGEGIRQAEEALEIYERLGDKMGQASCLNNLAWLFLADTQLDAAEDTASRTINLIQDKGQEFLSCESHRVLGEVYHFKGEREDAIHHFETALRIASPFDWGVQLFWIHYSLARLFLDENGFDSAHNHSEQAKSHAAEDTYRLGRAMGIKARIWYRQRAFENATSEVLRALGIFEKLGAVKDAEDCRGLLRKIERETKGWSAGFQRARFAVWRLGGRFSRS